MDKGDWESRSLGEGEVGSGGSGAGRDMTKALAGTVRQEVEREAVDGICGWHRTAG